MKYEIWKFDEETGQITVRYDNGIFSTIELPITDNLYPEGEQLDQIVHAYFPLWVIERKALIASGINNSEAIKKLVKQEMENHTSPDSMHVTQISLDEQEEMQIEAIREIVREVLKEQK